MVTRGNGLLTAAYPLAAAKYLEYLYYMTELKIDDWGSELYGRWLNAKC